MIICLCNRISDSAARDAVCSGLCRSVGDIYRCLGCRVQCGKCVPEMRRLFEEGRQVVKATSSRSEAPEPSKDRSVTDGACAARGGGSAGGDRQQDACPSVRAA
jgi:bacterioferritin-associated ferredoxin